MSTRNRDAGDPPARPPLADGGVDPGDGEAAPPAMDATTLRALLGKYEQLRELRRSTTAPEPARLRELAARFPGALREIDRLPMSVLDSRVAFLGSRLAGAVGDAPLWVVAIARYHGWMRAGLALKRTWGETRDLDEVRRVARERVSAPWEPGPLELEDAASSILSPPEGRLTRWVLSRIAASLNVDARRLELELFTGERP